MAIQVTQTTINDDVEQVLSLSEGVFDITLLAMPSTNEPLWFGPTDTDLDTTGFLLPLWHGGPESTSGGPEGGFFPLLGIRFEAVVSEDGDGIWAFSPGSGSDVVYAIATRRA
jgi:hypothetical protein